MNTGTRGVGLLAAVAFGLVSTPARAAEVREWPVAVPEPGRFEVRLDADGLEAMTAAGGVEVLDPSGVAVAAERFVADREERCHDLEVAELEREGDLWRVRLRVPEGAGEHASLRFELEDAVLASDCVLAALGDGGHWLELGRADLFRIGEEASLARTRFEYPPTAARDLALEWPAAAGFPRVRSAAVCAARDDGRGLPLPARRAEASVLGDGSARYRWPTPTGPVRLRTLRVGLGAAAPTDLAYRLRSARSGRWVEVARGRWPPGEEGLRLELDGVLDGAAEVALDLYGPAPASLEAAWEVERQSVRFEARRAGVHTLRIPASGRRRSVAADGTGPLPLGAPRRSERTLREPVLGAAVAVADFDRRWPVHADAAPGDPVTLTLPPSVPGAARPDFADLRLAISGRLVPSRTEGAERPVSLGLRAAVEPRSGEAGHSRWEIELPGAQRAGEPVQLLLRAAREAGPFERRLALTMVPPETDRRASRPRVAASETWRCAGDEPVPCELAVPIASATGSTLRVEIDDGDSAPLPRLDLELVGRPARVVFQWPGEGVELLAGAAELAAARFDLSALDVALELAPAAEARLGPSTTAETSLLESWSRPLLAAAIALVAVALLLLLRRLLPSARRPG